MVYIVLFYYKDKEHVVNVSDVSDLISVIGIIISGVISVLNVILIIFQFDNRPYREIIFSTAVFRPTPVPNPQYACGGKKKYKPSLNVLTLRVQVADYIHNPICQILG